MPEFIFAVRNHHSTDCGTPLLVVDDGSDKQPFRSYFENEHGEQWIFVHDFESGESRLFSGDVGWDQALKVQSAEQILADFRAKKLRMLETEVEHVKIEMIDMFIATWEQMPTDRLFVCTESAPIVMKTTEQIWFEACLKATGR